eukprot:12653675-Ditylum_brightwellii.AAC.1
MSKGSKVFGKEGTDVVLIELKQLHERMVMGPKNPKELTCERQKDSLQCLMFLTKKCCSCIKEQGCTADSRKQQNYTLKDETSVPTVATEALMLSCTIDAMESRDVTMVDIPGAFVQADMDGTVHMKIKETMAELLTK